jgi:hypothetical protein
MITIFCDFCRFSAKKVAVFLKNKCYDQNFASFSFVSSQKRQFFVKFFGENILKIITSSQIGRIFAYCAIVLLRTNFLKLQKQTKFLIYFFPP